MGTKEEDSIWSVIAKNTFTYFNLIFLILALLLMCAGAWKNLTFLPVVIINTLTGIIQQVRAKRILDKLTLIAAAKYTVFREGQRREAVVGELLLDDVLFLEGGQQIPADAKMIEGRLAVNESLLTGEADEIEKLPGDSLLSGSFVVSGTCRARLTAVGEDSYAAKLTRKAKEIKEKPSEMVGDINLIIKIAGIAIIPIGIVLFYQSMVVNGLGFAESVTSMVGAVIGMIPQGLALLATAALTLSAVRLSRKKVLLHDMRSTETLARVDVLCVDKTGTITTNEMDVTEIFAPDGVSEQALASAKELLASYIASSQDNNITAAALKKYAPHGASFSEAKVQPFSSRLKYSEIETAGAVYRMGAPEMVLCGERLEKNRERIKSRALKGERVLVMAEKAEDGYQPLLFVSLKNGIRPGAVEIFRYFAEQGIRVLVLSGDNPITVSETARIVGIPGAESYVDAGMLESEAELKAAAGNYTVFGRVKPEQKKALVDAWKEKGLRVAMTGDGVNDILAMKEADCSIAMGTGSDAAMQAAQVVLLDSDFSHMKEIISEGRRDINNLTRSAMLFLYKNIFSMLMAVFSILNAFSYPLQPSQVTLVSMFNIGIPAFALAMEANEKKQKGRFIKETLFWSLPAALTSFFSIAAMVVFGRVFGISEADVGVAGTFLLSIVGFMMIFRLCKPWNFYRRLIAVICIAGFLLFAFLFSDIFSLGYVSARCMMLAVLFAIAQESLMRNLNLLFQKIQNVTRRNR